ncbi:MAG: hypothetical protein J5803_02080 [Desulfovibrio sp.]|nr:hypothetical protein [Desulfovibrio sp.]
MKKTVFFCLLLLAIGRITFAASDKIDPEQYICAEYLTTISIEHAPPLFEGLQIDGYASAKANVAIADSRILPSLMLEVYALCQSQPEAKVLPLWQQVRNRLPKAKDSLWRADKTSCEAYNVDPNNGSGFVIWLDGYNRGQTGSQASVLTSDIDLNAFFEGCKREPQALMRDVMRKYAH